MKKYIPLILLGLFLPLVAQAAFTFDASSTATFSTKSVASTSVSVGSGSNEILIAEVATTGTAPSSVAVDGNAMTKAFSYAANGHDIDIWYALGLSNASHIVSSTFTGNQSGTIAAASFFGAAQSNPLDVVSTSTVSSGMNVTSSITTTVANDLLLGLVSDGQVGALTATGTAQAIIYNNVGVVSIHSTSGYASSTSAGSYKMGWTWTMTNEPATMGIVAFKLAAATVTTPDALFFAGD